jgi:hypothetical protein
MPSIKDRFARVSVVLAADVANSGTFDVAYPSGFAQGDFNAGLLVSSGLYAIVNGNDKWLGSASKVSASYGASLITVTNSSAVTWAASSTVELFFDTANGNNVLGLTFPVDLVNITGAQDVVTDFRPGVDGYIEAIDFVVNKPVTTASKLASLNAEINSTNLTGGVVALTSAAATPMGKVISGSAITAANRITKKDTLSIEASSVTAFSEGTGSVQVRIRLDDSDRQ